jgi:PIN domain nuclease of toxin-antitoxin system
MALVLDTHAVVRYLSASDQLSPTARAVIETAEQNGDDVFISAISLVEIIYLAERGRVPPQQCNDWKTSWGKQAAAWWSLRSMLRLPKPSRESPGQQYPKCRIELSPLLPFI